MIATQSQLNKSTSLRVAHFIIGLQLGGAERLVTELVRYEAMCSDVVPYLILQRHATFYNNTKAHKTLSLNYDQPWRRIGPLASAVRRVKAFIQAHRIDILHTHWWLPDLIGAVATFGTDTQHVAHLHTMCDLYSPPSFRLRRWLCRSSFIAARTKVVSCSSASADDFAKWFRWSRPAIQVLPNAVDVDRFSSSRNVDGWRLSGRPLRIGMAGRLTRIKGHAVLLDAISSFRDRGGSVDVQIAGDGECRKEIQSQIERCGLSDHVKLLGPIADMPSFYQGLDVLVQPTIGTEGLPLSILEAMSTGCLVIASDTGGVAEVLQQNRELLVPPNSAMAIRDRLMTFQSMDTTELSRLSSSLADRCRQQYGLDSYITRLHDFYATLPSPVSIRECNTHSNKL